MDSSLVYQLSMSPFMKPLIITNSNTRIFSAVKILLTIADSLAPNARIPEKKVDRK